MQRISNVKVFSKFDIKSRFWQIQISEKGIQNSFLRPFWTWNVMLFGLKNARPNFKKL